MTENEDKEVQSAAHQMMNDDMNFGTFTCSVIEGDDDMLEMHIINKETMTGMAFRCDGRIRPVSKDEAVRKVLGHD